MPKKDDKIDLVAKILKKSELKTVESTFNLP